MGRRSLIIGLACLVVITPGLTAAGLPEAATQVVRITGAEPGHGSGFVIAPERVVSNAHIVASAAEDHRVWWSDGDRLRSLPAEVLWTHQEHDLAVLAVPGLDLPGLPLATTLPEIGDPVFGVGYPLVADLTRGRVRLPTTTGGVVSQVDRYAWEEDSPLLPVIFHDADVHHGHSGGPLLNRCGGVVGVNTQRAQYHSPIATGTGLGDDPIIIAQGPAYASTAGSLADHLKQQGIGFSTLECTSSSAVPMGLWSGLAGASMVLALMGWARVVRPGRPGLGPRDSTQRLYWVSPRASGDGQWPQAFWHSSDGIVVGRDEALCDAVIDEPTLSRRQLAVRCHRGNWQVRDLHSTNGTWLSGRPLTPWQWAPWPEEATLTVGDLEFFRHPPTTEESRHAPTSR